jgi:hypothetical protein
VNWGHSRRSLLAYPASPSPSTVDSPRPIQDIARYERPRLSHERIIGLTIIANLEAARSCPVVKFMANETKPKLMWGTDEDPFSPVEPAAEPETRDESSNVW